MGNSNNVICQKCQEKKCKNGEECDSPFTCDCKCNINGAADIAQKAFAIGIGIGAGVAGIAISIGTGGIAIPIGGAMMGAGISSAYQGFDKVVKKERISGASLATDVAFGAVTGVLTGGIGAVGESVAVNVAKEGVKLGAKKLAVRALTGSVSGVAAKAMNEIQEIATTDKKLKDFGKTFDENGNENGTATSWLMAAAVGMAGGAAAHGSSNATKHVSGGISKGLTRVAISGATAGVCDAATQGVNIAVGNQKEFQVTRLVNSTAVAAVTTAAMEGTKNGIYAANGGKAQYLNTKANDTLINENNIPDSEKQSIKDGMRKLRDIPKSSAEEQRNIAQKITEQKNPNHTNRVREREARQVSEDIKRLCEEKRKAPRIEKSAYEQNIIKKNEELQHIRQQRVPEYTKANIKHFREQNNAHFLVDGRQNQVALDTNLTRRGAERVIVDHTGYDKKGQPLFRFTDYTPNHDYANAAAFGDKQVYHGTLIANISSEMKTDFFSKTATISGLCMKKKEKET